MGGAILKGFLPKAKDLFIQVLDHKLPDFSLSTSHQISFFQDLSEVTSKPDVVLLAVKPQQIVELLSSSPSNIKNAGLVLSVIAGKKLSFFEPFFSSETRIIRAMPNTPSQIGKGVSVCVSNQTLSDQEHQFIEFILGAVGDVFWINQEKDMDAVTALSGSGPAYLFYLVEVLEKIGQDLGLEADFARQLSRKMIVGAASLLEQSPDSAEMLRKKVTSPKGTTEAALNVLSKDKRLEILFAEALKAAALRSQELSREESVL